MEEEAERRRLEARRERRKRHLVGDYKSRMEATGGAGEDDDLLASPKVVDEEPKELTKSLMPGPMVLVRIKTITRAINVLLLFPLAYLCAQRSYRRRLASWSLSGLEVPHTNAMYSFLAVELICALIINIDISVGIWLGWKAPSKRFFTNTLGLPPWVDDLLVWKDPVWAIGSTVATIAKDLMALMVLFQLSRAIISLLH